MNIEKLQDQLKSLEIETQGMQAELSKTLGDAPIDNSHTTQTLYEKAVAAPPSETSAVPGETPEDTTRDIVRGVILMLGMFIGLGVGVVSYFQQFKEMWNDAGLILTLVAFPLFPGGGALAFMIMGLVLYLVISPFLPKEKKR